MGSHSDGIIMIHDLSGRQISANPIINGVCPVTEISNGVYIVSYAKGGISVTTQKIIIK